MISDRSKETIRKLDDGHYINSRRIALGGVEYSAKDVLVKAPLIAQLNVYYVGGTGRGKTQLGNDLVSIFGDSSCYAMGRPDFEPSELLKQINLGKLKPGVDVSDKDLVELTENVKKNLFFVDELNRCPPIVQNYFFDFADGKFVHNGKIVNLGTDGYSVLFATGNLGDG
ncbi:MAG TPA: AAA family ATPase [Candidatus Paceibacterota bacterium]|nr:AAA family ATPase [Candidatus Paceibacterota bacterium]